MSFRKTASVAFVLFWVSALGLMAHAANYAWVGGSATNPTSWNVASNWMPAGVPGAADQVEIGLNALVDVPSDVSIYSIHIAPNSTVTGAGNITVSHSFQAKDAVLDGAGGFNFVPGCTADFDSVLPPTSSAKNTKCKKKVKNQGKVHVNSGDLVLGDEFENAPEGTLEIKTDGAISWTGDHPKFRNRGKLIKSAGAATSAITAPFENTGSIVSEFGTIDLGPSFTQISGMTTLDGGNVRSDAPIKIAGGTLEGTGQVEGDVVNSGGKVKPGHSPGAITILGNFTQTANGELVMQIAGLNPGTQYDLITVEGTATLAGTLSLTMLDGFQPKPGDSFTLLEYLSCSGSFSQINGLYPGGQRYLKPSYTPSYFVAAAANDAKVPDVTITSPAQSALLTGQLPVTGLVSDTESGVDSVTLRLYRYVSSTLTEGYWNGTSWDAAYDPLKHERPVNGAASWNLTIPRQASGRYSLRATARDKVGNTKSTTSVVVFIDNGIPAPVEITTPANGANLRQLVPIAAKALDDPNGSGLARVDLTLRQVSSGKYWTGSTWGSLTTFPATFSNGAWRSAFTLPSGTSLTDGRYEISCKAIDNVGLNKSVKNTVTVDDTSPTVSVTSPHANATYKQLPSITGTAYDLTSGLSAVTVRLYRYASSEATAGFWAGGNNWTDTYSALDNERPVTGAGNWSITLPALTQGKYYCVATAVDRAGNTTSTTSVAFTRDGTNPVVAITRPNVNPAFLKSLSLITGTASDNLGLKNVTVRLYRYSTATYAAGFWAGSTNWTATYSVAGNEKPATGTTSWSIALPALGDGKYYVQATATDKAGNTASTPASVFTVDTTAPAVAITKPVASNQVFQSLLSAGGTASDAIGLSKVTVRLYRYATAVASSGFQLSDGTWSATYGPANELPVTGLTSWSYTLPPLAEGKYYIQATAVDKVGNSKLTGQCLFSIDKTGPAVSFTNPVNGSFLHKAGTVSGKALDNIAGIARVELTIQRPDGLFWTGSAWAASATLATNYTSSTKVWSYSSTMAGSDLPDGAYLLTATSFDAVGNSSSAACGINIDNTLPQVGISEPLANGSFTQSPVVAGTAGDDGSGLDGVTVRLFRAASGGNTAGYWNGQSWDATYNPTLHELAVTGTDSWSLALPTLEVGFYTVRATAKDAIGNTAVTAAVPFTIVAPVAQAVTVSHPASVYEGLASSPIALSTLETSVAGDTLLLTFTGSLNTVNARDVASYCVSVNGQTAKVVAASYNDATSSVTLQLAPGALHAGDQVSVSWQALQNQHGQLLASGSYSAIAR